MKLKGVQRKVIIYLVTLVLLCSFSFPCYGYDYKGTWGYNDSYINYRSDEDKKLIFFPLAPESEHEDYMIVLWRDDYYLFLFDGDVLFYGYQLQYPSTFDLYRLGHNSNSWEEYPASALPHNSTTNYINFSGGLTVIDATVNVERWAIMTPIDSHKMTNRTGYRIYWQLALIEKLVLSRLSIVSDYVLSSELLRYSVMLGFVGEVIFFVVKLVLRIGDIRNEKTED